MTYNRFQMNATPGKRIRAAQMDRLNYVMSTVWEPQISLVARSGTNLSAIHAMGNRADPAALSARRTAASRSSVTENY